MESLGEVVRTERLKRGLSQAALGLKVGVDGQTIGNLESGKTQTLKLRSLPPLANALGIPIERVMQLAGYAESTKSPTGNGSDDHATEIKRAIATIEKLRDKLTTADKMRIEYAAKGDKAQAASDRKDKAKGK